MNPCDTAKIQVDFGTVSEDWVPGVNVVAYACDQVDPFVCPVVVNPAPMVCPVPEPCCYCIYTVEWWALPNEPPALPDNREYFAFHCVEWLDPGHLEPLGPPIGDHVIPEASWMQDLTAYGGPDPNGYAEGEWIPLPDTPGPFLPGVARTNSILGAVFATNLVYWNSQDTLLNWKTKFEVNTGLGPVVLFSVVWSMDLYSGSNIGWPFAVGNSWTSLGQSSITPPSPSYAEVTALETITVPAFPGGIECYKVESYSWDDTLGTEPGVVEPIELALSGIKWYHNDYGCPIKNDAVPGALYDGYETQDMIWYCFDPPFPPFGP
jgi:hypothetical protein